MNNTIVRNVINMYFIYFGIELFYLTLTLYCRSVKLRLCTSLKQRLHNIRKKQTTIIVNLTRT